MCMPFEASLPCIQSCKGTWVYYWEKNLHLYSIKNDRKTTMVISMATICIGENKGASICRADQCLCFRYKDSTIIFFFLNTKFQDSDLGICEAGTVNTILSKHLTCIHHIHVHENACTPADQFIFELLLT